MDLVNIILKNSKDIKNLKKQICCIQNQCPPISASPGNAITCNPDGLFSTGGGGGAGSASNGLHVDSPDIKLGGNLIEATTITGNTTTETLLFTGVTANTIGDTQPNIGNSFFRIDSTYDLTAPDPQFGVTLGVSAPADGASNVAIYTQGGDTGIIVDGVVPGGGQSGVGIQVQGFTSQGILVNGTGSFIAIQVSGATTGIQASGNAGYAVKAVNGNFTTIYSETNDAVSSYTFQGIKTGNLNVGTIETLASFNRNTNAVVPANSAVSIDIGAPQVGNTGLKTIRLVSRNANQANNTSKFEIWGLNAGVETQLFTVDALLNGRIGIGSTMTSPTARLHLPAGAAGAQTAPLKFSSGTSQTTPEAGAMEYNGSNLFFVRSGTTRETVFTGVSGATAPATTTGVTITNFYGSAATNFLGDPNSWASVVINGTTYKVPLYT